MKISTIALESNWEKEEEVSVTKDFKFPPTLSPSSRIFFPIIAVNGHLLGEGEKFAKLNYPSDR